MKFLNATKIYKAEVAIFGGDLTGKAIVPIVKQSTGEFEANFLGRVLTARNASELGEVERMIRTSGYYPYTASQEEVENLEEQPKMVQQLFLNLMIDQVRRWISMMAERFRPLGIKAYVTGGNDDDFKIDAILKSSDYVIDADLTVVNVDEHHEMISLSYSNLTPWNCPRDFPEEELSKTIEALTAKVHDMKNCIFNFHVPPLDSSLDSCTKLDTSVSPPRPLMGQEIAAGSSAVRHAIERHQPLLGLHGHIHESRGTVKIGQTLCINPGSEYGEGILRCVIISLDKQGIKTYQLVAG